MKKQTGSRHIYMTDFDMQRLMNLIEAAGETPSRDSRYLEELEQELMKADVVDPAGIPPDVVTMNSRVCLKDKKTGEEMIYTLVFPAEANWESKKISVLAPVGMAMIGYRVGDLVSWKVPGGERTLQIKKIIYQPEAAGDFHL